VLRSAHHGSWIEREDAARDQPVEKGPNRSQAQFDCRCREFVSELLNKSRNVQSLQIGDRSQASLLQPDAEIAYSADVGSARVAIADVSGEEFPGAGLGVVAGSSEDTPADHD